MRQAPSIDSYGGGGFRVSGAWREGSLLIIDDEPRAWAVTRMEDLTPEGAPACLARSAATEGATAPSREAFRPRRT